MIFATKAFLWHIFSYKLRAIVGRCCRGTLKRGLAPPYGHTVTTIVISARCRTLHCARKGGEGLKNNDFSLVTARSNGASTANSCSRPDIPATCIEQRLR